MTAGCLIQHELIRYQLNFQFIDIKDEVKITPNVASGK